MPMLSNYFMEPVGVLRPRSIDPLSALGTGQRAGISVMDVTLQTTSTIRISTGIGGVLTKEMREKRCLMDKLVCSFVMLLSGRRVISRALTIKNHL